MNEPNKITVLGSGSWGTALAQTLARTGKNVSLWGRNTELLEDIANTRTNTRYHPNIRLDHNIQVIPDFAEAVKHAHTIIYSLPSYAAREYFPLIQKYAPKDVSMVSTAKGIENDSLSTVSEIALEILGQDFYQNNYASLSGPSLAHDVIRNLPTAVTVASENKELAQRVQSLFHQPSFHVFTSSDVLGLELGGALKNVFAIVCGFADGFNFGENTRAALITISLSEVIKIGLAKGADPLTFSGLSGLGDLILTCTSNLSRNRRVGLYLAEGKSLKQVIRQVGQTAEGIRTAKSAYHLAEKLGVETTIIKEIYLSLHEGQDPHQTIENILNKDAEQELSS